MSFILNHGDCLTGMATLADKSIDVVITDPPYSEHVHTRSRGRSLGHEPATGRAALSRARDLGFVSLSPETMQVAAESFGRLARRWVLVFSDTESDHLWRAALTAGGLEYVRTCFWHKVGGTPQFTGDRPGIACEAITVAHLPGRKKWNGGGKQGIYSIPIELNRGGENARIHTTQKPLPLLEALVRDFSNPGELILDPFAGSGTTGVAALRNGRRFIGWEQDAAYHAAATKRLDGTREQGGLFEKRPKAKQTSLIADVKRGAA